MFHWPLLRLMDMLIDVGVYILVGGAILVLLVVVSLLED